MANAINWNWRKLGFGSGALVSALSTVFVLNLKAKEKDNASDKDNHGGGSKDPNAKNKDVSSTTIVVPASPLQLEKYKKKDLKGAISKSRKLCKRIQTEMGLPGLTVGVSVNGKMVWKEGFGYANLENKVKMKPESIMRIASISKSMTMAMLAKLMEEGKIDIDKPIQAYLPTYPESFVDGEKVTITTRHLLSHISGIRHYEKKGADGSERNPKDPNIDDKDDNDKSKNKKQKKDEMSLEEYFLKQKFASVEDSLKLFQNDALFHKPGTKYLYTTHGWTVVAAIIEKLVNAEFPKYSKRMFDYWGLKNTYLDIHEPIIYNRTSYYTRQKGGELINSPYVDNSYKWAGGGFLSNVLDLNQFAHMLLYSMQTSEDGPRQMSPNGLPRLPFLKQSTIKTMWTGNPVTARPDIPDVLYALGFVVGEPLRKCMFCKERELMTVFHTGAAVGSSSVLFLAFPLSISQGSKNCDKPDKKSGKKEQEASDVQGVVVSMITNLTSIGLKKTAEEIAANFRGLI